jgi:GNAT superfamily N-acetyltransferase
VVTPRLHAALRAATPSDVDAIAELHLASWRAAYRGIVPDAFLDGMTLESRVVRWRGAVASSLFPLTETMVAVDGDTILGVCSFGQQRARAAPGIGEIYVLHIRPDSWRRGVGTLLLDDARAAARCAWLHRGCALGAA